MTKKQKKLLLRIIIAAVMMISLHFVPLGGIARFVLYLVPYTVIGYDILRKAFKGVLNGRLLDESFLMCIATLGAIAIGLFDTGDYTEAVAVMLFYQTGELFQSYAVGKSRKSIAALMDIRPDYANIERDGSLEQLDPESVAIGDIIVVQPGERVPLDGIVTEGISKIDTSALTGESAPKDVHGGDEIISGCINLTGLLKVRVTKEFSESTVSKVLELVENASSNKSRSEAFISRFARVYTPAVCLCAAALAVFPPVINLLLGNEMNFLEWLYRSLTFLVASCPCALVISIPLSFFAGIGGASREGILVKGSNYLEALSKTGYVAFDKTGTLTKGAFEVTDISPLDPAFSKERLLEIASLAESASSHPISKSLQRAYGKDIDRSRVCDIQELSGYGVTAAVDGLEVAVGNARLMQTIVVTQAPQNLTGTVIHISVNREYAGYILISDIIKPNSACAINELRKSGVRETILLTGDSKKVAEHVSDELGIDTYYAELLPKDKVTKAEEIISRKAENRTFVFVGDGINDAPVLSRADIGIAMGAMGSDAAIEAADVVLMDDDPAKIAKAIKISRKCLRIVYENTVFAISVKLIALILVALGSANMWMAVFADVGVMVLAILNAIRALFIKGL